jgi:4-hydroxybutyrate CoA-transferase
MLTLGEAAYTKPEYSESFRHNGLFLGSNVREAIAAHRADYVPIFLSEIEGLIESGELPIDTALIQTAPPDQHGFLSFGTGVDCSLTVARHAHHVIVEVNDQMPRTHGDCYLHIDQVSAIVETSRPLPEHHAETSTEIHRRIARNVASLISDGSTLQMGIGAIPDAVLSELRHHRNLGVHSEMVSDGIIPLVESGVINGAEKTIHRGKIVLGFVLGSKPLFDFIRENVMFEFHPITYANDPFLIAQNLRMVSINSAIEVDITGQVCADSIGSRPYSGFGGQVDYIRGAARSKGGKPIIALPSTAKNGTRSRIVTQLSPGAGVVTSRADVHYVVTEHGVAYLHGKNLRQRAQALAAIAHPAFRDELLAASTAEGVLV